jgi:hypothetical protein
MVAVIELVKRLAAAGRDLPQETLVVQQNGAATESRPRSCAWA